MLLSSGADGRESEEEERGQHQHVDSSPTKNAHRSAPHHAPTNNPDEPTTSLIRTRARTASPIERTGRSSRTCKLQSRRPNRARAAPTPVPNSTRRNARAARSRARRAGAHRRWAGEWDLEAGTRADSRAEMNRALASPSPAHALSLPIPPPTNQHKHSPMRVLHQQHRPRPRGAAPPP